MTYYDHEPLNTPAVVDSIAQLLDPVLITHQIDDRIEAAARSFKCPAKIRYSIPRLIGIMARFLRHVQRHAFAKGWQPTSDQARDEAIALLDQVYGTTSGNGFKHVLAEVTFRREMQPQPILEKLARYIMQRERLIYTRWEIGRAHV